MADMATQELTICLRKLLKKHCKKIRTKLSNVEYVCSKKYAKYLKFRIFLECIQAISMDFHNITTNFT